MSAKSKPSTGCHAALSKISETSSRALMEANLTGRTGTGSAAESEAADDAAPVDAAHRSRDGAGARERPGGPSEHGHEEAGAAVDVVGAGVGRARVAGRAAGRRRTAAACRPPPPLLVAHR